jgi:hypothetical protein
MTDKRERPGLREYAIGAAAVVVLRIAWEWIKA